MKVYDKAQWHIDNGENSSEVIAKFQEVFSFLNAHKMLSTDGLEIFEFGVDGSISLNEKMVTEEGQNFLDKYYDTVINCPAQMISDELERGYAK